jgi:hypothetical protein
MLGAELAIRIAAEAIRIEERMSMSFLSDFI